MNVRLNRRRSSSLNSNSLLSTSLKRRNSLTASELEQIQTLLQKKRQITAPLIFLILSGSPILIITYQAMLVHNGPIAEALNEELTFADLCNQLHSIFFNPVPWLIVLLLIQFQLLFLWYLPAEDHEVITSYGVRYYARFNGFESGVLVILLYILGSVVGLYSGDVVFVNWIGVIIALSAFAMLLQVYLFVGCPQETIADTSFASDVFFGRHLRPIVFGVDVKGFITNRIMYTLWSLYIVSALFSQKATQGRLTASLIFCATLQLVYLSRRLCFEYVTRGMDDVNDRMGFYRIWGVLVVLPTVYMTPITVCTQTSKSAPIILCAIASAGCMLFQYFNTVIDLQKHQFRAANGRIKIDGKDPYYISAKYRRDNDDMAVELLLGSGYWGKARHLNYTAEFLTFAAWSAISALVSTVTLVPVVFLGVLLYVRMQCDESRCLLKYTHHWLQYISKVNYLIIPCVY